MRKLLNQATHGRGGFGAKMKAGHWAFPGLLLITTLAQFVPLAPAMPASGLDPSWVFGMNQAVSQGLVFGKDIVFTFGPYASIYTRAFHPASDHLMVWGGLYLGFSFFVVAYLNFRESKWYLKGGLLLALSGLMYPRDPLLFSYALLVGAYVFRAVQSEGGYDEYRAIRYTLLCVLFAPLGLLPLVKGSALIGGAAIVGLSLLLFGQRKDWRAAALVVVSPSVALVVGWAAAAQPPDALSTYLASMMQIVGGYTEAMGREGRNEEVLWYLGASGVLLWSIFHGVKARGYQKTIVLLMFVSILLLGLKGGFVRHDDHAIIGGTLILLAALVACTLVPGRTALLALFMAVLVCLGTHARYERAKPASVVANVRATYARAWEGFVARMTDQSRLEREFVQQSAEIRRQAAIPVLEGTTDIYSFDQSYLIASGNKWNPRPILQSYSAYTPPLIERNRRHLLGHGRPDNIVFKIQPIDHRIPTLEDGASWPVLLANYSPTGTANGFLILKHRASDEQDHEEWMSGQSVMLGQRVDVPKADGLVFARVNITPTILGRVTNTLFRPTSLEIALTLDTGEVKAYRVVAGMAKTGFLISPLVENTGEFCLLYAGDSHLRDKRVRTISIDAKGGRSLWNEEFTIEFSSVRYRQDEKSLAACSAGTP